MKVGELATDALDISAGTGFRVQPFCLLPCSLTDGKVLLEEAKHADQLWLAVVRGASWCHG